MPLLYQTGGVLVATVLVARFAFAGAGHRRYALGCLVVVAGVSCVLAFTNVDSQNQIIKFNLKAVHDARAAGATDDALSNGAGQQLQINTSFTDFVRARIPAKATYYLAMPASTSVAAMPHWITYRMLPRIATHLEGQNGAIQTKPPSEAAAKKSDWVVFYGVDPKKWALRNRVQLQLDTFSPGFAVGRRVG